MKNIYHKYTLFCRLFTLLACLSFSAAYGSRGIDPVSGRKADPAKTTADLLRRRLIQQQLNAQSSDPLYFMLRSNKTEVKPGEEVELTLSVHLLQDAHKTFIVYEELFGYTLRLIMPEGFVVNGGSYHDLLRDRVTRRDPVKTYTVKGYFEDYAEDYEFKLLRGVYYHQLSDNMILKQVLSVSTTNEKPFDPNKKEKVSSKIEKRELMSDVYSIAAVETIPDQPLKNAEFCTTNSFSVSKGSRFDFDDRRTCLREVYAPKWFIINVTKAGSLKLKISSPNNDVDFVCYGPYNIPLEDLRNRTWDNMRTNDRIQDASVKLTVN